MWNKGNNPPYEKWVEVKVRHCNPNLKLDDKIIIGKMKNDNFYIDNVHALSYNWDIIEWKILNKD